MVGIRENIHHAVNPSRKVVKMIITVDISLQNFNTWSGANATKDELTFLELQDLEDVLIDLYPDGLSETALNDIFWFENDWIAETLGYEGWEDLLNHADERQERLDKYLSGF